jgi:parvulin-like peptidyl-prolyl isomerase
MTMRLLAIAMSVSLALGCGSGTQSRPEPKPEVKAETRPELMPAKLASPEPERILVAHVLVAFSGAARSKATRTREQAEKLAYDVLSRARKGEDFNKLMKEFTDDPGGGVYGMANHRVSPKGEDFERKGMVPAFGDVGFKLEVGSVGMALYDPQKSPFGYHIIKRLE